MADILGVTVDNIAPTDLSTRFETMLSGPSANTVVTPNAEMVLDAQHDAEFRDRLNNAHLRLPDSVSILYASAALGAGELHRISGVSALTTLMQVAAKQNKRVFLLGGYPKEAAESAAMTLKTQHPNLHIKASSGGRIMFEAGEWHMNPAVLDQIKSHQPDVLVVALGHKKQEHWMESFVPHLPSVRVAIGVGGALDFLAGNLERAPEWMQKSGLEFLFRLQQEPARIKRIYRASVVFPIAVALSTIQSRRFFKACRQVFPLVFRQLRQKNV